MLANQLILGPDDPDGGGRQPAPGRRASDVAPEPRPRILIVEDEFFAALSAEAALLDAGFEVAGVVATGEEAVARAGEEIDLALMDIRLAGAMDGVEAAAKLRAAGTPSLFTSAHSDLRTRARAEAARPMGWLVKPFSDDELLTAVRVALRRLAAD